MRFAALSFTALTCAVFGAGCPSPTPENPSEVCDDRVDNDDDSAVDCVDSDCADDAACAGGEGELPSEGEGDIVAEGEGDVAEGEGEAPPRHEASCTDGDDDGDGAADCADDDCAADAACQPVDPNGCDATAVTTLDALKTRYVAEIDPLMRRQDSGCIRCHADTGRRELKMTTDPNTTFDLLIAGNYFDFGFEDSVPARVFTDSMPKAAPPWTATEKETLRAFSCAAATVVGGGEGEGEVVVGEGEGEVIVGEGEGEVIAGEGEGEGDPGDVGDVGNPTPITLPFNTTTDIGVGGDLDCYTFTLAAAATITATPGQTGGGVCDADFDTVVTLFEGKNAIFVGDDTVDGDLCGDLTRDLGKGIYTVCVNEFDLQFALDGLTLSVASTPLAAVADDVGNALQPTNATLPFAVDTTLAPSFDSDCRKVAAAASSRPTFFTTDTADTVLEVFNSEGVRVANDDDNGPGLTAFTALDVAAAGDLVACVSARTADPLAASTTGFKFDGRVSRTGLVIAAVDYDTPGSDTDEAIVITNTSAASISLSGFFVASVNGANSSVIKSFDLTSAGSLDAGASVVVAQNPFSFTESDVLTVIDGGATSFLQNGGAGGDAVVLVNSAGAGSVVDSVSWDAAVSLTAVRIGGVAITASLQEGAALGIVDSNATATGLCRRHNEGGDVQFAQALDSNDGADWITCQF